MDIALPDQTPKTTGVPLLSEVFDVCLKHKLIMNVEIKASKHEASTEGGLDAATEKTVELTLALLKEKFSPEESKAYVRVSSFDRTVIQKVIEKHGDFIHSVGALFNGSISSSEVDGIGSITKRESTPSDFTLHLRRGWQDSVNLCGETISSEEVKLAHSNEVKVMAWYPGVLSADKQEDGEAMKILGEMGVDCVCTNKPQLFATKL
jgi:glycerophosphoryl diester phosphodiesterase